MFAYHVIGLYVLRIPGNLRNYLRITFRNRFISTSGNVYCLVILAILPSKGFPHQNEQFTTLNCLAMRKVKREESN